MKRADVAGAARRILRLACLAALPMHVPAPASAQAAEPKSIQAVFTASPPTLDGRLDDPVWQTAAVVDDLHTVVPTEYTPPSEHSLIRVLYGRDALYFAARFFDSEPDKVSARVLRQGDFSWGEDGFSVILDPYNQGRSGYIFDLNPNGVRTQALYNNVTEQNWQWQAIWRGAARRDDQGWTAEVAIPFKTLSFDPDNETWGINFIRWLGRRNERFGWVSHNREQNPANSGQLTGLTGIESGIGLDVVPGIRMARIDDETVSGTETLVEPSLDVFYKVTPTLTAALTVNTDFSGTTADARRVNLTRFDLFFPEQRKFFLQDADIFEFGRIGNENGKPFFSRRIGLGSDGAALDIDAGAKVTGRAGPFDIGVLGVRQETADRLDTTELMVARVAANVLDESSVGVIATHGNPVADVGNSLVGADFRYLNTQFSRDRTLVGSLWYQHTDTDGVAGESAAFGTGFSVPARRGWQASIGASEIQRNYNPALGFANRTGIRQYEAELGYNWRPLGSWLRSVTSEVALWRVDAIDGGLESQDLRIGLFEFENQAADHLRGDYHLRRERLLAPFEIAAGVVIPAGDYSFETACIGTASGEHRVLSGKVSACGGDFYDGTRTETNVDLVWRPSPHLRMGAGFEWNDIALANGAFITRLARLRADIAFTATWYWENLVQYDNVSETIGVNSILRWVPEAGREMVFVMNRQVEDFDRDNRFDALYSELRFKLGYTIRF
ncbi:MAG: sugar-binding protein [Woeseiaceae bacterium]|nr:sugar-binding protein [Woeseiaceae bacterium]